ncbi:MAG: efflux RND transporter permease subunit [Armatimonadota bacterium]
MSPGRLSVARPVAVTMRIAALVLLGAVCLFRLPLDLLPKVALPTVVVITQWPNVAPEEIDTQVTRPIEQAVSSASGVNLVSSTSSPGSSNVRIQFNYGVDVSRAAVDVLQLVERARQRLPSDPTLQSPVVYKLDPSQLPILIFGVSGVEDPARLKSLLVDRISPILQSADGVASAVVTGGADRAILVDIDPARLRARGLSLAEVGRRIVQENLNLPAGIAKDGATEYTIRSMGWLRSIEAIADLPVGMGRGRTIRLRDVATLRDGTQEIRIRTRLDGEPAVGMIVVKQSEANTVATAEAVRRKIQEIGRLYPQLEFGVAYDQSRFIVHAIDDVKWTAFIGSVLAVAILLAFLRNLRGTLVVALSIPISILSTFTLLYFCGFTLNTLTLSGLSLATGLIVDDAVVVLENIYRHIERGKRTPREAAIAGTDEITSAVVSSTVTIMVVFLPLFLVKGQTGQLFSQFALVVIFAIAISLLDALTVVPMLASRLVRPLEESAPATGRRASAISRMAEGMGDRFAALDASYRRGLAWALAHRWPVFLGGIALSGAGTFLVPWIGTEVLPATDSGNFNVTVRHAVGTAFETTDRTVVRATEIVRSDPDVETVFAASGTTLSLRGTTTALSSHQGSLTVRLRDDRKRATQQVIKDIQRKLGQGLVGARATVTPFDLVAQILSGGNQNVEVDLFGGDLSGLVATSRGVLEELRAIPGMENADTNLQDATPELQFAVDRDKAQRLGLSFADIAGAVGTATNGSLSSWFQEGGFQYPIVVRLPEAVRKSPRQLLDIPVAPASGGADTIPLGQVAKPVPAVGPNEITRQNSQRYIAITAVVQGRAQSEVIADIERVLAGVELPEGVYWTFGRQQQQREEDFAGLGLAVGLAIVLIYMLLASQFESLTHPLTILTTVPLSVLGVILALFLTGRSFGLTAYIGVLLLVGIVVKNGILLIEYANQLRERGFQRDAAVLEAAPARLRPILMTTCAAILGMVPLAMGWGRGTEIQTPLATAVIGGLATSTFLTLFVVPVVYTLLDDFARFLARPSARD